MVVLSEAEAVDLGLSSAEEMNEVMVFQALDSLTGLALDFITEEKVEDVGRVIQSIREIADLAVENKMELVAINSILAFGKLANEVSGRGYESILEKLVKAIGKLGRGAGSNALEAGSKVAITTLMEIRAASKIQKSREETITFSVMLTEIGTAAAEQGLKDALLSAISSVGEIGKNTAGEKLETETVSTLILLEDLGKVAAKKYYDEALSSAGLSIEEIGKLAFKKQLNGVLPQAQWALKTLNVLAEEQNLEGSAIVAELALENLKNMHVADTEENIEENMKKLTDIKELHTKILSDFTGRLISD
jgi:hypothetical protein